MTDDHAPRDEEPRVPQPGEPGAGSEHGGGAPTWPAAERPAQQSPAPGPHSPWSRTGATESVWSAGLHPTQGWAPGGSPPSGYAATAAGPSEPPRRRRRVLAVTSAVVLAAALGGGGAAIEGQWDNGASTTAASSRAAPSVNTVAGTAAAGSVQKVAAHVLPSVVTITVAAGDGTGDSGSGVILTSNGTIMTNNHVVSAARGRGATISVTFHDASTKPATIIGTDKVTDLAVIKAQGVDNAQPAVLSSSDRLAVGQPVVAIGTPLSQELSGTVTSGIVSAINRPISTNEQNHENPGQGGSSNQATQATVIDAIQTDAAINFGNSGGPLVNMNGEVVGVNQSTAGQSGNIGIGFAIPMNEARSIVTELITTGKAEHAQLGVSVTDASSGNAVAAGALLRTITTAAAKDAGLHDGDIITHVGNRHITNADALIAAVRSHRPGDTITLTYTRNGTSHTTKATLGSDHGQ